MRDSEIETINTSR